MYSGYITINETTGKSLFYFFVESSNNPSTDPVIVWFQGGPGCSGLFGAFLENGPFIVHSPGNEAANLSLTPSPFSWNRFANMLYVEAPVGVGFSYSNVSSDYDVDNNKTAADNLQFLEHWFAAYAEFQKNELWIAGESYGGDYVPQVVYNLLTAASSKKISSAESVFEHKSQHSNDVLANLNLVGFMIGNPVMYCQSWIDYQATIEIETFYYHGIISFSSYLKWKQSGCNSIATEKCNELYAAIFRSIGDTANIRNNLYNNPFTGNASLGIDISYLNNSVPFVNLLNMYMNRDDVQAALHARRPTYEWLFCCNQDSLSGQSNNCTLNYTNSKTNMIPFYLQIFAMQPLLEILIYSGDVDMFDVPFSYTQLCLNELNRTQVSEWRPWYLNYQTAGYIEIFDRFTYATVKAAGHTVPFYQPYPAYALVSSFVNNKTFDLLKQPSRI